MADAVPVSRAHTEQRREALVARGRRPEYLTIAAAILLMGLVLQFKLGCWWADPVTVLVMVPIIAHEGLQGLRGRVCDDCHPQAN